MSEYMMTPREKTLDDLDNTGTLFDETFNETLDAAVAAPVETVHGVALNLNDRDLALHAIDKVYAQRNQARGFNAAQRIAPYQKELYIRYNDPSRVGNAMSRIADSKHSELQHHIDTLTKRQELYAAGMGYDATDQAVDETRQEIRHAFGEDTNYHQRQKTLGTIDRAAKKRHESDAY